MPIHPTAQKITIHKDELALKNVRPVMRLPVSGAENMVLMIAIICTLRLENWV